MKEQITILHSKLAVIVALFRRYAIIGLFLGFMAAYSVQIVQFNRLYSKEPSETEVNSKLETVQRPAIDQKTLTKIEQLQAQNIEVQALFDQARQNPFSEN